ncbi:MAG: DNA-binding response regulator [Hyphomicrobiales bacterium]
MTINDTLDHSTVLVVDDAPDTLSMLSDAILFEGMTPHVAENGHAALGLVNQVRPDIVLLDAMMPGLDGFETCRIIKEQKGCDNLPIIFMTGSGDDDHVVKALSSGGVDFVVKPVVLDHLFARMKVHLANARLTRSARNALDLTGRKFVACDPTGTILWSTPQASDLLRQAGLRSDIDARLPWEIVEELLPPNQPASVKPASNNANITYTGGSYDIIFKLFDDSDANEYLIQLVDGNKGSYEQQLAKAFALTVRESDVLLWITYGKSNKEIAEILNMSPRTVNKHLEQIFIKLAVENRTSAATLSVKILWSD